MVFARPAGGTRAPGARPAFRLLPMAAFGIFCFILGTRLSPAAKQQPCKQAAPTMAQCQALLQVEPQVQAAPLKPCEPAAAVAADPATSLVVAPSSAATSTAVVSPYIVPINITQLLDEGGIAAGVLHAPYQCLPPWELGIKDESLITALQAKLAAALVDWARPLAVPGTSEEQLRTTPLLPLLGVHSIEDPRIGEIDPSLSDLLSRFMLKADGTRLCTCGQLTTSGSPVTSADDVGSTGCMDGESEPEKPGFSCMGSLLGLLGYMGQHWSVDKMIEGLTKSGICSNFLTEPTFAVWWIRERLNNPAYRAFNTDTVAKDTVLELFDMLYEKEHIFLRQKWLGFAAMQNGFDLFSISNLIYELRPDVIVETGTAAGGSAILWASILDLLELHDSRIHTIDNNHPSTGFGADQKGDPTKHRLWTKYAVFHQGISSDPAVLAAIKAATQNATTVLVLLDSDHSEANVAQELQNYCQAFVTVGSYCVAEDTKMTRMGSMTGPLDAVKKWLGAQSSSDGQKWEADRSRELLYTHHPMGYLKRTA